MKKKIVGIVPQAEPFDTDNVYDDKYHFVNTYGVRAAEAGLDPIGVLPVDKKIKSSVLDLCDCFIIQGGSGIWEYHLEVMEHAVKTGKKVLGICLGCQTIQTYFYYAAEAEKAGWTGSVASYYAMQRDFNVKKPNPALIAVPDHRYSTLPRGREDSVKHPVTLEEDSMIFSLLGEKEIMGATIHRFAVGEPAPGLKVTGRAGDGVIEAIEFGTQMIGTQFHPDVDSKLMPLFRFLAE